MASSVYEGWMSDFVSGPEGFGAMVLFMGGCYDGIERRVRLSTNGMLPMTQTAILKYPEGPFDPPRHVMIYYVRRLVQYSISRIELVYALDDVKEDDIVKKLRELRGLKP